MKKITSKDLYSEVIKKLTAAGYKDNWVHGLPHIKRIRKNYTLFFRHTKLPSNIAKSLKIAVDIHDVGRAFAGNHAENSSEIFKQMQISDLNETEKNDIEFAVKNHSIGLLKIGIKKPKENKEILLGLLCLIDHMDGIGKIGILRAYQWVMESQEKPEVLSRQPVKTLERYLKNKYITTKMLKTELKAESVLTQLIYNYLATFEIIEPVKNLLNKKFLKIIDTGQKELLKEINYLLKLTKKNQEA